jgi:DNA polymerase III subunit delta'
MWKIIGQKRALSLLQGSLSRGKLAHAYLFSGPTHVGKMTLARELASALNCTGDSPPCGECPSCLRIASNKHADVLELGLGKNAEGKMLTEIGIEEIRQIQHSANLPPFEGKCRVYIVNGAELLSTEAANCLLKTLEEPLEKVVFILLTSKEQSLLTTVISRCQRIELLPIPKEEIRQALVMKWNIPEIKADLLARLSHGSLGWAVRAAEEDLLEKHSEQVTEIVNIVDADLEDRFNYAAQLATEFGQDREKVQEKLSIWLDWWHDLLMIKCGLVEMITNIDRLDVLKNMSENLEIGQIRTVIEGIISAAEQLKMNANARLTLEVFMLGLPAPEAKKDGVATSR